VTLRKDSRGDLCQIRHVVAPKIITKLKIKLIKNLMMTTLENNKDITHTTRSNVACARVARWVKEGNTGSVRALSHNSFQAVLALDDMRLLLSKNFRVPLRAKQLFNRNTCEKNVKQFCGELLDRCVPNHWKTTIIRCKLGLRERASIASSLFSIRKLITSEKPDPESYVFKMTQAQSLPPVDFLLFCSQQIRKIFKTGWDAGYWNQVNGFTPPNKANVNSKEQGTYRHMAVGDPLSRGSFLRWCGGTVTSPIDKKVNARAVLTGGKWRVITLSDPVMSHLLPLHRTIYERLTKERWLLRGEAVPTCFEEFARAEGERIVSGDYESATDNLNVHVSEHVLRCLMSTATHVPTRVREEAMGSLRMVFGPTVHESRVQRRGQLMGNPLSFPLLCLINFLTFKYAVRREVPVKINGDDIVFKARQCEIDNWFRFVSVSGLKVSVGKTLVSSTIFSLNSTYFRSTYMGVTGIEHFRASAIFRKCEDMAALTGRVAQIGRDLTVGETRNSAIRCLLRRNFSVIFPSQGSFSRRYTCPLPRPVLQAMRLTERESFYANLTSEPAPLPKYSAVRQDVVPVEWKKETRVFRGERKVPEDEVVRTFVDGAWTKPLVKETRDEYWGRVRDRSLKYTTFRKQTYELFRKFVGGVFKPSPIPFFETKENFWVERPSCEGTRRCPVAFRSVGTLFG